jgi:hypothetical protein
LNRAAGSADQSGKRFTFLCAAGADIRADIMEIRLRSTVGGFSPDFMRKLPELEKAMLAHGLEPSEFLISKDRASPGAPWITPFFYLYTVFVGDENFALTEPNDERFYDYLYKRVIAEDDDVATEQAPRRPGLITRFFRWMDQPI